jgi:hypothetical protein
MIHRFASAWFHASSVPECLSLVRLWFSSEALPRVFRASQINQLMNFLQYEHEGTGLEVAGIGAQDDEFY